MSEQGTHFWHMSFLGGNSIGMTAQERVGHWTPPSGITRFDAMQMIRSQVVEASPYLADAVMISFDVQRNDML